MAARCLFTLVRVKSAFYIWVNGKKVGYSEDSKLAAEFDITKYVKPGKILWLCRYTGGVMVVTWSARICGVFRELSAMFIYMLHLN
ncbi:sugar-binding domain-containing protein [Pedobacter steynii]